MEDVGEKEIKYCSRTIHLIKRIMQTCTASPLVSDTLPSLVALAENRYTSSSSRMPPRGEEEGLWQGPPRGRQRVVAI